MRTAIARLTKPASALFVFAFLQAFAPVAFAQSVFETSIADLQRMLAAGEVTSAQLVEQYLARIEAYDRAGPRLNSIVRINPAALEQAQALDLERAATGPRGPLHGIPVLIKDNYNTTDMPTTGSSVALAEFVPNAVATQVEKLLAAGAIVLAKTNLHEYAYGITSISSLVGQTRNPYDYRRVPGGSSGGTGAAVAASFGAVGMGSDTCGSIRIPSAFNNLVGLRPSKGLSSIHGVMPLSHTQDTAGPLARNTDDLAIVLDAVSGYDPNDPATEAVRDSPPTRFRERLGEASLEGLRFGKLDSYFERADDATRSVIEDALEWLEAQGATVVSVEIPEVADLISRSGALVHEFRTDLDDYLTRFGSDEVAGLVDIIELGLYHQAVSGVLNRALERERDESAYQQALAGRGEFRAVVEQVFEEAALDALVYPTIAQLPVFIGEAQSGNNCRIAANTGLPALSLPAGFSDSGLPVGMEFLGEFLEDERLLAIGHAIETGYGQRQAPAASPALVNGAPPPIRTATINTGAGDGFAISGEIRFDAVLSRLAWNLQIVEDGPLRTQAIGLAVGESAAPISVSLIAPEPLNRPRPVESGSIFLSPRLREALATGPAFIKAFGGRFPPEGAAWPVNFAP